MATSKKYQLEKRTTSKAKNYDNSRCPDLVAHSEPYVCTNVGANSSADARAFVGANAFADACAVARANPPYACTYPRTWVGCAADMA